MFVIAGSLRTGVRPTLASRSPMARALSCRQTRNRWPHRSTRRVPVAKGGDPGVPSRLRSRCCRPRSRLRSRCCRPRSRLPVAVLATFVTVPVAVPSVVPVPVVVAPLPGGAACSRRGASWAPGVTPGGEDGEVAGAELGRNGLCRRRRGGGAVVAARTRRRRRADRCDGPRSGGGRHTRAHQGRKAERDDGARSAQGGRNHSHRRRELDRTTTGVGQGAGAGEDRGRSGEPRKFGGGDVQEGLDDVGIELPPIA